MNWQLRHESRAFSLQQARSIQIRRRGQLTVLGQPAWLTVDGEAQDRVMQPGESLQLQPGHRLVIEPWVAGGSSRLLWQPTGAGLLTRLRRVWHRWPRGLSAPAT